MTLQGKEMVAFRQIKSLVTIGLFVAIAIFSDVAISATYSCRPSFSQTISFKGNNLSYQDSKMMREPQLIKIMKRKTIFIVNTDLERPYVKSLLTKAPSDSPEKEKDIYNCNKPSLYDETFHCFTFILKNKINGIFVFNFKKFWFYYNHFISVNGIEVTSSATITGSCRREKWD